MHIHSSIECNTIFEHIKSSFNTALTIELDIHTADQMDVVLSGAMQYAKYACTEPQILELRKLWLTWKYLYLAKDAD